jgi:hypothetical protein
MSKKQKTLVGIVSIIAVLIIVTLFGGIGRNKASFFQHIENLNGKIDIRDKPGVYLRKFATVTPYARYLEFRYNENPKDGDADDERIKVTFNDGGVAHVAVHIRVATPINEQDRKEFHKQFAGNMDNIKASVRGFMTECLKSTAPCMSASEHQSARKGWFNQKVEEQLTKGVYETRKVEKTLKDRTDEEGQAITVFATEIVTDENGVAKVAKISPITDKFKMEIIQFSITGTKYDDATLLQFAAKQQSFLKAEQSKAERGEEVQQRLMVEQKGLREKAEAVAKANVIKATAVIQAEQKAEVALQVKIEAETKASQFLAVAKIKKAEAETLANQKFEVAKINYTAAEKNAAAIIVLAEAEEKRIQMAGAITEKDKVLAEIAAERDVQIAMQLSKVQSPGVVFSGGGKDGSSGGSEVMMNMINYRLLEGAGLIPTQPDKVKASK